MAKQFNSNKTKYFVLTQDVAAKGGVVSFRTYTDHANALGKGHGVGVQYVTGVNDKNQPIGKWFELSQSRRTLQVRETDRDINGILMYDFIKNSPECEGSPNLAQNATPRYKEMNEAKDAVVAIASNKKRTKALAKVWELEESGDIETLAELAAHIGYFDEPNELMIHKLAEWAEKRPEDFFEILETGDRPVRAAIRKALHEGVFTKRGPVIYWESTVIGANEDDAVSKIITDKEIGDALKGVIDFKPKEKKKSKS